MPAAEPDRDWPRFTAWALLIGVVLGGLETIKAVVVAPASDPGFGWVRAAVTNLPWWLLWSLLAPVPVALNARLSRRGAGRATFLAANGVASILASVAHLVTSALVVWAGSASRFQSYGTTLRGLLVGYFFTDLVTYWAIAAAYGTYASRRRLRDEQEETRRLELRTVQLEAERARLEAQMTEARLEALRMELNPHFLFNALNGVSALAGRGESEAAVAMLARLGALLRRTLDETLEPELPLTEEIELLNLYLEVERTRFGPRLATRVEVAPEAAGALVPAFILQPLVENAIRHGVEATRGEARVEVEAYVAGGSLEIAVRDSGPGPRAGAREGLGMRNTRSRLATLYGDAAAVEPARREHGITEVRLRLPFRVEEDVLVAG